MSIDFSQYRIKDNAVPDVEGRSRASFSRAATDIPRQIARSAARVGETAVGLPGDILDLASSGANWLREHLPTPKSIKADAEEFPQLPTSKDVRKGLKKLTGSYLEPRSDVEKTADEYLQLATSLAIPGPKTIAGKKVIEGIKRAGSLAGLSTATKEGLKYLGVDEDTANIASFAALAVPGLLKGEGPRNMASRLYKEAEQALPSDAVISSHKIVPHMEAVAKVLERGTSTPSKSAAIKTARDIVDKGKSGMIDVEELTAFKRDINELMKDPALLRRSEKFLPQIGKEVDNLLEAYGKGNPGWIRKYRLANQIYGSVEKSRKASETLFKLTKHVKNPVTLLALGMIPAVGGIKAIAGLGGALATKKGYEIVHRIFTSPSLRKYYGDVVKEATKGNIKATAQLLRRFDEKLDDDFPNWDQYRIQ